MTDNDKTESPEMLYDSLKACVDATIAGLGKQIEKQEYQQWLEEYRQLVFAKEIRVDNSKPMLSRRAKRRQRNKGK